MLGDWWLDIDDGVDGKVSVVTGGSSGIGKATVIRFGREGAMVVIAARRVEEGEQTVKEIGQAGGEAIFLKTDVSQASEVEVMVDNAIETYDRIVCAFNAGAGAVPIQEVLEEDWGRAIE